MKAAATIFSAIIIAIWAGAAITIYREQHTPHLVSAKIALKSGDSLVCWLDQDGQMQLSKAHSWEECAKGLALLMSGGRQ